MRTKLEELKAKKGELENAIFAINMIDHWSHDDHERYDELNNQLKQTKEQLKEIEDSLKTLTITGWLNALCEQICDNYCKYPSMCENEDELMHNHCNKCPLVNEV